LPLVPHIVDMESPPGLSPSTGVPDGLHVPDWTPAFPSREMVSAAAAMFSRHRVEERPITVGELHRLSTAERRLAVQFGHNDDLAPIWQADDREQVEGPRFRIEVAPGCVSVRSKDPVRAARSHERGVEDRLWRTSQREALGPFCDACEHASCRGHRGELGGAREHVTEWSRKSRARMVERLAQLDYAPLFEGGGLPAMVTLTYPADWLTVAPSAAVSRKHLEALRMRYKRSWGRPLVCVWKREFQRRGAPHFHLLMVPPGPTFRTWLSETWAAIVCKDRGKLLIEYDGYVDHIRAGTGVDYAEGMRARDPKRLGVYFSKHGIFAAKDYQNVVPEEWEGQSAGRFWGYWGLQLAVAPVEVSGATATDVLRTLRRYSDAQKGRVRAEVWRKVTTVDRETGEIGFRWRKRHTTKAIRRLRAQGGYLVVNDGAVMASSLARYVEPARNGQRIYWVESGRGRLSTSGRGPIGFLP
jgi:hypothetical protein